MLETKNCDAKTIAYLQMLFSILAVRFVIKGAKSQDFVV